MTIDSERENKCAPTIFCSWSAVKGWGPRDWHSSWFEMHSWSGKWGSDSQLKALWLLFYPSWSQWLCGAMQVVVSSVLIVNLPSQMTALQRAFMYFVGVWMCNGCPRGCVCGWVCLLCMCLRVCSQACWQWHFSRMFALSSVLWCDHVPLW